MALELRVTTVTAYLEHAFERMLEVADRVGEESLGARPLGPSTNSVAGLVVHCCGVVEYWLGHVALGEPSDRDRDAEFGAVATSAELRRLVDATLARCRIHLDRLQSGRGRPLSERLPLYGGDRSDAAIALHVLEECFQHLGHAELTADVLRTRTAGGDDR